jgi:hypothetical protein
MAFRGYPPNIHDGDDPGDFDETPADLPTRIVVTVWHPVECVDFDTGQVFVHTCPSTRAFPLWMRKAPEAWADYYRRKFGEKNVAVDYD